jgi:hypothetical protein
MNVTIDLPEDISRALQLEWGDVSRRTLEAMAAEGYRSRALTEAQVRRMLGLETGLEVHAFLKRSGVHLDLDVTDLEQDLDTLHALDLIPKR